MNRFVTFCIKIGIALLVLAVISNTAYAATTTETADSTPTMIEGTISAGTYANTWSDDGATQDLLEAKVSGKYYLYCYYNLSTAIDESRIAAFEIGVNAWYSCDATDSFTVYVWNDEMNSWDSTTITVTATSKGTTAIDTTTMGIEHIRDSDGNIAIRFDDNDASNKQATLYIDYLYVKLTYTTISGVATGETYKNGETITTTWTSADGFGSGESYINVEYWDVTAGTQFDLKSYDTSATSSTSEALTSSEVGHKINVYVYTSSSSTGDRSTAVTQGGDPWPYSITNAIQSESWNSYNDPAHKNPDDTFSGEKHTVYMHGPGFAVSHDYKVAYYDAGEDKIATHTNASDSDENLDGQYYFPTYSAVAGLWHSVVYDATDSPPSTYNPTDPNKIANDSFTVLESAIPEFPAVIAAIAICMLCAVAYMVMRRRAEKG